MADQKFFTYGPDNVGPLLSTTLSAWLDENLEDQVFNIMPLWKKFLARAKYKNGGASLLQPVMFAKNSTAQFYAEYEKLNITPQTGFTMTQAKWINGAVSISISGDEEAKNAGDAKKISLLESKTNQAMQSIRDLFSVQLFGTTTSSKQLQSLVTMVDATSTIQDVNSTSNSWWQATVTTGGSFVTQGLDDMRTTDDTVDEYNPQSIIDTCVMTKTVKNYYEASLTPGIRYSPGGTGKPTFQNLMFRNQEIFSDPNCTSGVTYTFSMDDLFLVINSNSDMKSTPFVKPANQDARVAQIILRGQLVARARRKIGKITTISA